MDNLIDPLDIAEVKFQLLQAKRQALLKPQSSQLVHHINAIAERAGINTQPTPHQTLSTKLGQK